MGKKRAAIIGSSDEEELKAKKAVKLEQKKLREGQGVAKKAKVAGMGGGQRVVDTTTESLEELETIQQKLSQVSQDHSKEGQKSSQKHIKTRSKTYKSFKSLVKKDKVYTPSESITLLRKISYTKFDPSVELHLVLKHEPETKLSVTFPHHFGKSKKVVVADDKFITDLEAGHLDPDIDCIVASPAQMGNLVKFAKLLGPKGLMPNPKNGTISPDPITTAKKLATDDSKALKTDKSGFVIHTTVGKLSMTDKDLIDNISAILSQVSSNLKKAVLKSTMSPAIKIQA